MRHDRLRFLLINTLLFVYEYGTNSMTFDITRDKFYTQIHAHCIKTASNILKRVTHATLIIFLKTTFKFINNCKFSCIHFPSQRYAISNVLFWMNFSPAVCVSGCSNYLIHTLLQNIDLSRNTNSSFLYRILSFHSEMYNKAVEYAINKLIYARKYTWTAGDFVQTKM